ncbi:MAG: hypothetical protein ACXAD7_06370 [Candidatus Kariarchaeaceae archaeon]|jgi:hypothetical protein
MVEENDSIIDILKIFEAAIKLKDSFNSEDLRILKKSAKVLYDKRVSLGLDNMHFEKILNDLQEY